MNNIDIYMSIINKYFNKKKAYLFMDFLLENYNNRNYYFRIDYYKKERVYKLSFIDINSITSNNIETWINTCLVDPNSIYFIEELLNNKKIDNNMVSDPDHRVSFNFYLNNTIHIEFNKFLPIDLYYLVDVLIILFNNSPKRIEGYFYQLVSLITDNTNKYTYNDEVSINFTKGDFSKLFDEETHIKGKKCYEENQVKFLEKIDNKYYAMVDGACEYVVIIEETKKNKYKIFCSCPCEDHCSHIYAVLTAIKNNEFKPFYKVVHEEKNTTLLDRLMYLDYYLCVGIDRGNLKIINNDGNVEVVPLLDINNRCNYKVIEDDDKMTLSTYIKTVTFR